MKDSMVQYVDKSVENGNTYWYAVTSYDDAQPEPNESVISAAVSATPRPQGIVTLSIDEGFDFDKHQKVQGNSRSADIVFDVSEVTHDGIFWRLEGRVSLIMVIRNEQLRIQDMGYTEDFSVIDLAPFFSKGDDNNINDPRRSYTGGVIEIRIGHTYVVWFDEERESRDLYGKFRISEINPAIPPSVTIEWALQEKPNTPQLAPAIYGVSKGDGF